MFWDAYRIEMHLKWCMYSGTPKCRRGGGGGGGGCSTFSICEQVAVYRQK